MMAEIKEKFPEFKTLDNMELELVLKLYEDHLSTPFAIANPAYYTAGTLTLMVCTLFVNSQHLGFGLDQSGLKDEHPIEHYS